MPDDIRDELLDEEEPADDLLDPEELPEEEGDFPFLTDDVEGEES
jgi:hypothetical protein